jgi:lipopolysaccharide export system permease protein
MSLFKRAVVSEATSHASVVFSTLLVVWLSVVLVRLLGEAAAGRIGADVVVGLAAFTTIAALPTVLAVSVFIGVLTTVSRSYRESEMVVWFSSGLSLAQWVSPILRLALPAAVVVAGLTLFASPWAQRQIEDYRARFELRSDLSRISTGQFLELDAGNRVIFVEPSPDNPDELGQVFVRLLESNWLSLVAASSASTEIAENGDRFLVLGEGARYDIKPGEKTARVSTFDAFGVRLESKGGAQSLADARNRALNNNKARPTGLLLDDGTPHAKGQIMWRLAIPLATINLALLAIPLGAVNPRIGRSFDLLIAGLIALLYMNSFWVRGLGGARGIFKFDRFFNVVQITYS